MELLIYYSKYGHTKAYAQWIQEALQCDIVPVEKVQMDQIADYDTIIFGHSVFAGRYKFGPKFSEIIKAYPDKNYVFFSVNLAETNKSEADRKHLADNIETAIDAENMQHVKLFFLRGGIDYSKLNFIHRAMMWMMNRMLKNKAEAERSESDQMMIDAYGKELDFMSRDQINDLVAYVKGLR